MSSLYTGVNLVYVVGSTRELATLTWQTGILMVDSDYGANFMEANLTLYCQTCVMLTSYMSRTLWEGLG